MKLECPDERETLSQGCADMRIAVHMVAKTSEVCRACKQQRKSYLSLYLNSAIFLKRKKRTEVNEACLGRCC